MSWNLGCLGLLWLAFYSGAIFLKMIKLAFQAFRFLWVFFWYLELTPEEKSLLQKGPKCAVTPATIPIKTYISTTTVATIQAGELNGVDCSGLYHDVNRILYTFTNKPIHANITKSEHLALENLGKHKDCIIVKADKCVALVCNG